MKNTIICTLAGIFLSSMSWAGPAGSGGSAGGAVGTSGVAATPRTGATQVTPNTRLLQSGTTGQNGATVQNGVAGQNVTGTPTASSQSSYTTNGMINTNAFAGTNGMGNTNNFAGTNGFTGSNNVIARVNSASNTGPSLTTNFNGNIVSPDQAVTPSDRILLTTLSQGVRAKLGIVPNGNTPVHFLINNGTVTVMGTVQSTAQSQSVLSQVQQTPGVLSVINDMHVASPLAAATTQNNQAGLLGTATDRAFSAPDQRLLTTVQQEAATQLGVTSLSQMPVHFSIQNGVVAVTGQVNSLQEKQVLLAALARTPGIVRVVDNVGVIPNTATGTTSFVPANSTTVSPFVNRGNLSPTGSGQSNAVFLNGTNRSGF